MERGEHGTPLPAGASVWRMARATRAGNVSLASLSLTPDDFQLSSHDRDETPPHLSVWETRLTLPEEAHVFSGAVRPIAACLKVDDIRSVCTSVRSGTVLDCVWTHLERLGAAAQQNVGRPGYFGHAGIVGADAAPEGLSRAEAKLFRKDLRLRLAELAVCQWRAPEP